MGLLLRDGKKKVHKGRASEREREGEGKGKSERKVEGSRI